MLNSLIVSYRKTIAVTN